MASNMLIQNYNVRAFDYNKYIPSKTDKLVHGFVRWNMKTLKLLIPTALVQLFILFINQFDTFSRIFPRFYPWTYINNQQTAMRNEDWKTYFKEVYGSNLIQLEHGTVNSWKIEINNMPFNLDKGQLRLGVCDKVIEFDDKPLDEYHYYGIDNKYNHSYRSKNNGVMVHPANTHDFQGKRFEKYDIITIEVIKWYGTIHLNFYVNGKICMTYNEIEDVSYRLFISSDTQFVCCSLKQFESSIFR